VVGQSPTGHAGYFIGDVYSSGNVGIGTDSPSRPLHLVGANPRILIEANATNAEVNFKNSDDTSLEVWSLYKDGATDDLRFYQNGDKLSIDNSSGNVGIGTHSPGQRLDVDGGDAVIRGGDGWDGGGDEAKLYLGDSNHGIFSVYGQGLRIWTYDDASSDIRLQGHSGTDYLTVLMSSGRVGIGTTTPTRKLWVNGDAGGSTGWYNDSDACLKQDVSTIENALEKVKHLRGVNFRWKNTEMHSEGLQMGMIAQEVNDVVPEVVEKKGEYYSMNTSSLVALLVEAIKEQQRQIEELKVQASREK
jgi:hypothetical protein